MRPIRHRFLPVLLSCVLPYALATYAFAAPPQTLSEALKRSTYTVRRTPLIIVNAEGIRPGPPTREVRQKLETLYQSENANPPLTEILDCFNSKVLPCSSVQVVAPITRVALNPNPGPPEEWVAMDQERAAKLLFASLTPEQWTIAASAQGIGLSDLSKPEQKVYFRSLIAEPFTLTQFKEGDKPGVMTPTGVKQVFDSEKIKVRVVREMTWTYRSKSSAGPPAIAFNTVFSSTKVGGFTWMDIPGGDRDKQAKLRNIIQSEEPNKLKNSDISFNTAPLYGKNISLQGIKTVGSLVQRVAEQTGLELYADRRFSNLNVSIIGPEDAEPDAADVMKALCYAVGGAIRRVSDGSSTVYILTSDRKGAASPWLQLTEWASDVDSLAGAVNKAFDTMAHGTAFVRGIGFAPDSPRIGADLMNEVEAEIVSGKSAKENWVFSRIPVSQLPPDLQQRVTADKSASNTNTVNGNKDVFDYENIYAQFFIRTQFHVPGFGALKGPRLTDLNKALSEPAPPQPEAKRPAVSSEPVPVAPALAEYAVLKIAPRNNKETEKAVSWAAKHGFMALFVKTSLWDSAAPDHLSHAVEFGRANGIKIFPSVSLLRVPVQDGTKRDSAPNNLQRTHNVLGEALRQYGYRRKDAIAITNNASYAKQMERLRGADWLEAEDQDVQQAVAAQLHILAKIPGIEGIVLEDGVAPGYAMPNSVSPAAVAGQQGGYNDELRVALIRRENIDPIDLATNIAITYSMGFSPFKSPFEVSENYRSDAAKKIATAPIYQEDLATKSWKVVLPDKTIYDRDIAAWGTLRGNKNGEWIGQIRNQAALPGNLSVYWQAPASDGTTIGDSPWAVLWEGAEPTPPLRIGGSANPSENRALLTTIVEPTITPESMRSWLATDLKTYLSYFKPSPYNGWVIDITSLEMDKALATLDCLEPISKNKPAESGKQ